MSEHTFHQEYLNEFWDTRANLGALAALGDQYHRQTEEYDRIVCRGRNIRGVAIPANGDQRKLIVKFANQLYFTLGAEAQKLGFSADEWRQEVQRMGRTYDEDITQ